MSKLNALDYLKKAKHLEDIVTGYRKMAKGAFLLAQEAIISGSGTGDILRDYVIISMNTDSEKLVEVLREIEKMIEGKIGEPILFINEWEESMVRHIMDCGGGPFGRMMTQRELHLGTLDNDKLVVNLQEKSCDFPIQNLIEGGNFHFNTQPPGSQVVREYLTQNNREILQGLVPYNSNNRWSVAIGTGEITSWLTKHPSHKDEVIEMSHELGLADELEVAFQIAK